MHGTHYWCWADKGYTPKNIIVELGVGKTVHHSLWVGREFVLGFLNDPGKGTDLENVESPVGSVPETVKGSPPYCQLVFLSSFPVLVPALHVGE